MMIAAMDRILGHVVERVVHPSHIPFVGEAQAAARDRSADARPGGRFLCYHHRARTPLRDHCIEMAQETDRFQIFAAAVNIRNPLAFLATVIAIKHGGDGVDAQAVNMEMLQPVECAGDQKSLHLAPAKIVDVGIPVAMNSLARIEVLIERGAVETGETMWVVRKMRRHPVENYADAGGMQRVDEA